MEETTIARPRRRLRLVAALATLGLILTLGACGDDDDDDASPDAGSSSGSADATLAIDSNSYTDVNAPAGGTLEIVNNTGASHTFTADDGAFDDPVAGSETVDITVPTEAGEYPFHCEVHPSMTATLTVE